MLDYSETKLYELISHDENGEPVVYRGRTVQSLHQRMAGHLRSFDSWLNGKGGYCSSYEVLKYGGARIELVRIVCCLNIKDANRVEGLFIRELPTCVNIIKNMYHSYEQYYTENKNIIINRVYKYRNAHKDTLKKYKDEYYQINKDTIKANSHKRYHSNKETILAKEREKVTCECGEVLTRGKLSRHRKRMTHIRKLIYC